MTVAAGRPPRWSKKTDQLVDYVAQRCRPGLQSELGQWLESSPRFRAFVSANQDKVRKKLNSADDDEGRLDVRAELRVAYQIVGDRRCEVAFEAYGARRLGPDLTVTFRANQRFNLEVTRVRAIDDAANSVARLANVITGKLRQLPGDMPNALVIAARGLAVDEDTLGAATRLLKMHTDQKDDAFFAHRGLKDAREFYVHYLRLSGTFVLDEASVARRVIFASNREARQPLSRAAVSALLQSLG